MFHIPESTAQLAKAIGVIQELLDTGGLISINAGLDTRCNTARERARAFLADLAPRWYAAAIGHPCLCFTAGKWYAFGPKDWKEQADRLDEWLFQTTAIRLGDGTLIERPGA